MGVVGYALGSIRSNPGDGSRDRWNRASSFTGEARGTLPGDRRTAAGHRCSIHAVEPPQLHMGYASRRTGVRELGGVATSSWRVSQRSPRCAGLTPSDLAAYSAELRAQASRVLQSHPGLSHDWHASGALRFPASSDEGFEVVLKPDSHGIVVFTSVGFHKHFEGAVREVVQEALGFARDLLSPDTRVREHRAGGRPYRWNLERRQEGWLSTTPGDWAVESVVCLVLWNFFGRRTERIYQNAHLPRREREIAK